ncbi:MAG: nucleotidyltransferase family protein, partial [Acidobacteriota bacterium]
MTTTRPASFPRFDPNESFSLLVDLLRSPRLPPQLPHRLNSDSWNLLLSQARSHYVSPFLYTRLRNWKDRLPPPVVESLRDDYRANGFRNLKLTAQLSELAQGLRRAEVPFLVLKGMHLVAEVYADPSTRFLADIDLLVSKSDLGRASETLRHLGYVSDSSLPIAAETRVRHHLSPFVRSDRAAVDVHWSITLPERRHSTPSTGLWERCRTVEHRALSFR